MPSTQELLEKGFFPRELPPPFTTRTFAGMVAANLSNLPIGYHQGGTAARVSPHNLARTGSLRRKLGIPNPVSQTYLSTLIAANYPTLEQHVRQCDLSKSIPALVPASGRALFPEHSHSELPVIRASTRSARKYVLRADLVRFYPSIYIHTIPWALHTKLVAKRNRGPSLFGNQLDKALRDGQDGQTIGIPIGPDTSLVVAEVLLASVDIELRRRVARLVAHRHVDDYEVATLSRAEAEDVLGHLQECLGQYELALNPGKTHILQLPQFLEAPWVAELRGFPIRSTVSGQAADLIRFADRAYGLATEFPEDSVRGYSLSRLRGMSLDPQNWPLLEDLLFQAVTTEPSVITLALEWLSTATSQSWPIDRDRLEEAVNSVILGSARAGHGNEVAWALWTCVVHQLQVHSETAAALSRMLDSVVAVLALDADSRHLVHGLDKSQWVQFMTQDDLWGEHWLLAYEANAHGWLPSLGGSDHVDSEPHFAALKRAGIRFYDSSGPLATVPSWTWTPPAAGYAGLQDVPGS